jgi:putative CocE/NonD family hydrolase
MQKFLHIGRRKFLRDSLGIGVAPLISGVSSSESARAEQKPARPGKDSGYSDFPYDGYQRFSEYVTARDGTKLALDYYRPTKRGELHTEKLPVVWSQDRYLRAIVANDRVYNHLDESPKLFVLLTHGYVIATADLRGAGASFGVVDGWLSPKEAEDSYDLTEWLAAQPWSTGKVGMTGRSYLGVSQYFAASEAPPSLKAIMPESAWFDGYESMYPGGIFGDWWIYSWSTFTRTADIHAALPPDWRKAVEAGRKGVITPERQRACSDMQNCPGMPDGPVSPVDADVDGQLLARAIEEHKAASTAYSLARHSPFRDSRNENDEVPTHIRRSSGWRVQGIAKSDVAAYHVGGWFDGFCRSSLLWQRNYPKFSKVVMGPWLHDGTGHIDLAAEYVRWFDHWLKGIDNGITKEPRVTYFTMGAPDGHQWRTSDVWPLASERLTRFYFDGQLASGDTNNHARRLALNASSDAGRVDYVIDYTTNMGNNNRWTSMVIDEGKNPLYANLRENDEKGLTFTTEPLASATEVTGHPVAHLWLTSSAPDVDIFVYLVEARADGSLHYITEGQLRASHRALADPPYDRMGLPYHRSFKEDVRPIAAGEIVELAFDLQPTSILFQKGSRIRITITGADRDNFDTPIAWPAPTIEVLHGGTHASYVELPVIGN